MVNAVDYVSVLEGSGDAEVGVLQNFAYREHPGNVFNGPMLTKLQWYVPPKRLYSRRELLADRLVNFSGAGLSWLATPLLGFLSWSHGDPISMQLGFWTYGFGLITMLNCSALYHYWCWDWRHSRQLLTLDHLGISAVIMGTYTPIMIYCRGFKILAVVYTLGVLGLLLEGLELVRLRFREGRSVLDRDASTGWNCLDWFHVVRYLVMGWAVVPILPFLFHHVPSAACYMMVTGGLLYTFGVIMFIREKTEFHQVIWHTTVLAASVCFYLANVVGLVGMAPIVQLFE
eukprot:TRINITY_DN57674_c0_g1_i1.p1 TRINITY_DN57674_c0_g1~~TRINITY_DN57674_c0_g1_i1.p1  ORF type:complete len:287 (+),score=33.66 TRINITY_DN57674_c0_g1_i1:67-927(+)